MSVNKSFLSQLALRLNCFNSSDTDHIMKRITTSIFTFVIALFVSAATAHADLDLPDGSQLAVAKQRVGLTDIKITYHRLQAKQDINQ